MLLERLLRIFLAPSRVNENDTLSPLLDKAIADGIFDLPEGEDLTEFKTRVRRIRNAVLHGKYEHAQ